MEGKNKTAPTLFTIIIVITLLLGILVGYFITRKNDKKINVSYTLEEVEEDYYEGNKFKTLTVNGHSVIDSIENYVGEEKGIKIASSDEIAIISYSYASVDYTMYRLYIFDKNGNDISSNLNLEELAHDNKTDENYYYEGKYTYNESSKTLSYTLELSCHESGGCYDDGSKVSLAYEGEELVVFNGKIDTERKYEITYISDGKFSSPKLVDTKSLPVVSGYEKEDNKIVSETASVDLSVIEIPKLKSVTYMFEDSYYTDDFSKWRSVGEDDNYIIMISKMIYGIEYLERSGLKEAFKSSGIDFGKEGYVKNIDNQVLKEVFKCDISSMKCSSQIDAIKELSEVGTIVKNASGRSICLNYDGTLSLIEEGAMLDSFPIVMKILKSNIDNI